MKGGWNKVKLYFMLGLPTQEDMEAIAVLADKVARRYYEIPKEQRNGKCQITASSSFFIPKPFSPFQWAKMYKNEEYIARAAIVNMFQNQLNRKKSEIQLARCGSDCSGRRSCQRRQKGCGCHYDCLSDGLHLRCLDRTFLIMKNG